MSSFIVFITIICVLVGSSINTAFAASDHSGNSLPKQLPSPPSNFDPLLATGEELAYYGFPEKPSDPTLLAQWEDIMSHAKYYKKPKQSPTMDDIDEIVTRSTPSYSRNWAGYTINAEDNNNVSYDRAWAKWSQPNYSGPGVLSFWTGVGRYEIVQAGTACAATNFGGDYYHQFWVENWPENPTPIWIDEPTISDGNDIAVVVTYGGATSTAMLENYTTTEYTIVTFSTPDHDGLCADYIHEQPTFAYPNWGSTDFFQCGYHDSTGNGYLSDGCDYQQKIMTDDGTSTGVRKAWPSGVSSSGFWIYSWQ